ncbi:MAG TPA: substrate-binding domain-containing protein [Bellilinea sp.]|nr:substrate-binding domain-containing protein [Bellilinea sp.]
MDETPLYQRISAAIRQEILDGKLLPGQRLPPLREVTRRWNCTPGTVQRAYRDLADRGLALSRPGKGTYVAGGAPLEQATPLRRASLVHRAEAFLLEALTAGHSTDEIEQAVRMALDHWRVVQPNPVEAAPENTIRFSGSHDPAVSWLAEHFSQVQAGGKLVPQFTGSLGGLIALAEGKADVAGAHLWDESSDSYNAPFVRRLLPGQRAALVHLAYRRLGLILPAGNPYGLRQLSDLTMPGLRFINRQPGSGTRVWLDAALRKAGVDSNQINGYAREVLSHSEVARAVAEGSADCGFGLETSALAYQLDFVFVTREEYHLVIPSQQLGRAVVTALIEWLAEPTVKSAIAALGGYDTTRSGRMEMIEP